MTSPDRDANPGARVPDGGDGAGADLDSAGLDGADLSAPDTDDADLDTPDEGLLSRLAVIEDQPLEDRAAAFGQLYDGLRQQLEA